MTKSGPGKSEREGISAIELADMFPSEEVASAWFESHVWPDGRHCPRCGGVETIEAHGDMPYWCPAFFGRCNIALTTISKVAPS